MATSAVPTVKDKLVTLLRSATWPGGTPQVSYGLPQTLEREIVAVAGVIDSNQTSRTLGPRSRTEEFTLELFVRVARPGDSQQDATERAFELMAVVEDTIRSNDPNLGIACVISVEPESTLLEEAPSDDGFQALIDAGVRVVANLAPPT